MGKKARYYLIAIYQPDEKNDKKVKILGRYFIKKNKDKAKILYKNKIYELKEYFEDIDENYNHKDLIKLKIIFIHNIIDMSYMFYGCYTLISLSDNNEISNIKIYITNSHCMFRGCKSLISLPDLSIWDTSKVFNMSYMFYRCKSLLSLPNISKWNYSNVIYISNMFGRCKKLSITPKITIKENKKFFSSDLKIIVIGTSGCDKAQFVNKWTKNTFNDMYKATIVSEFGFKIFEYGDDLYRIQLWDLAGQDKNAMVTKIFAKDAKGVVVMSDATNIQTREDTIKWKNSVDDVVKFIDGKDIPCILVENKIDLLPDDDHYDPTFEEFYKNNGFTKGFRVSSKTGENVDEAMKFLIKTIIKRNETYLEKIDDICDNLSGDRKVIIDFENHDEPETKTKRKIIKKGCY